MTTLSELEDAVERAKKALEAERARIKAACPHTIIQLTLDYSGVSSYRPGVDEHGVTIRCACGTVFAGSISIHRDL